MLNQEVANQLAEVLRTKFGFVTQTEFDRGMTDLLRRADERRGSGNPFSISKMIRGLRALRNEPINPSTAEEDVKYTRALTTGTTPGSYLVPTLQADEIIAYLNLGGVARASGFRVWDMSGIQRLNVPTALSAPSWVWMAENSQQTATDPNIGQLAFDLLERRALVAVPNQLIAVSVPAFDAMLSMLIGLAAGEHEDTAIFASSTVSGGPTALMSAAGISTVNCAGSANGGNLGFTDLLAVLAKAAAVKARGPFAWYASPRTFWQRIYGLVDSSSRPLFIPTATQGLQQGGGKVGQAPTGMLLGYPVYVTPAIPENEALGSGSNQSHLIFTNPSYCHIAQDGNIEVMISLEKFFDSNQTAIRAVQHIDAGYAPPQGITVLEGIN